MEAKPPINTVQQMVYLSCLQKKHSAGYYRKPIWLIWPTFEFSTVMLQGYTQNTITNIQNSLKKSIKFVKSLVK